MFCRAAAWVGGHDSVHLEPSGFAGLHGWGEGGHDTVHSEFSGFVGLHGVIAWSMILLNNNLMFARFHGVIARGKSFSLCNSTAVGFALHASGGGNGVSWSDLGNCAWGGVEEFQDIMELSLQGSS